MQLTKERQSLIKNCSVIYLELSGEKNKGKPWRGRFTLGVDGYDVNGKTEGFATIDEAVSAVKEGIVAAIDKFTQ